MTRSSIIFLSFILLGSFSFADDITDGKIDAAVADMQRDTSVTPSCESCNNYTDGSVRINCLNRCTPSQSSQTSETPAISCNQQLAQLTRSCNESSQTAQNDCDESQNTGLAQAQQAAVVLGQQVSASVQAACSSMGKISQAANAATAAYQMTCQSSVGSCTSTCNNAIQYFKKNSGCVVGPFAPGQPAPEPTDLTATLKTCTSLQKKADTAQQAVNNFMATTMQAQNCEQASSGTSTPAPEICKANPNIAGCTPTGPVDCTKPEMASNKVCVCSKNPNDPSCMSGQSTNASNSPDAGGGSAVRTGSGAADGGLTGDNYGLPDLQQAPLQRSAGDPGIDGKQGSGANISSSNGGSGGADGKGGHGGAAGDPVGVNAGFYGGGGGSSGAGYGGGGSGDGYGGRAGAGAYAGKTAAGGPNLRQFLPGGQFDPKARGVAGVSGPDGITGPHSNIWQKIQNRYQVVTPTLMP